MGETRRLSVLKLKCYLTSIFAVIALINSSFLEASLYSPHFLTLTPAINKAEKIKPAVLAKVEKLSSQNAVNFMKTFYLGELLLSPYQPELNHPSARSQATLVLKLPQSCGSVHVKTGICYRMGDNTKSGIGSQEQVVYVVSTKRLEDAKWKPFISFSFLRSHTRGTPRAFMVGLQEMQKFSSHTYNGANQTRYGTFYQNMQVFETSCGLQPFEKLSLVLSFNFLKPLNRKGLRLNTQPSKVFDDLKLKRSSQGVDLKVGYALKKNLNLLVKSEYLMPKKGVLRDKDAKPVLIEGQLIVSF